MKRILWMWVLVLLCVFWAFNAYAWEASIRGQYQYEFKYFSRVGPGDLFGNAERAQVNTDPGRTSIGLSGPVMGTVVPEGFSSKGSDGAYASELFELYPTFIVNRALRLNGIFAFQGALNGPYAGGPNWATGVQPARYFSESRSENIYDPVAAGFLRALWVTAEIPWGRLEVGRRPFGFGLGWSGFHSNDSVNTSISLMAPWGPCAFTFGIFPHDTGEATDPLDSRNANLTPRTITSSTDRNEMRAWNWWAGLTYRNGPLELGAMGRTIRYNRVHAFPIPPGVTLRDDQTASFAAAFLKAYRSTGTQGAGQQNMPVYGDVLLMTWPLYAKYFDGRFFLNGEIALQYVTAQRDGGRPISGRPYAWMLEGGALWGPWKASLAYFYRTGHDKNGGMLDIASSTGQGNGTTQVGDSWSQYIVLGGAGAAIEPYNWLIGEYGTLNNSFDAAGRCTYLDFKAFTGRLDYSLASNLNFWASYMLARRASNTGTVLGQYTGGLIPAPVGGPNVADDGLGWELDAGYSWKLLEGFTWDVCFGYWKVGNWPKGAYVDWSSTNIVSTDFGDRRVDPNRNIDPIMGLKTALTVNF